MAAMTLFDLFDSLEDSLKETAIDLHHCVDPNRAELEKIVFQAIGHIKAARTLCRKAEAKAMT